MKSPKMKQLKTQKKKEGAWRAKPARFGGTWIWPYLANDFGAPKNEKPNANWVALTKAAKAEVLQT